MTESDVPYGEDFHVEEVAVAWADAAGRKRPWRPAFFERFAEAVRTFADSSPRVLELGSGPGFLAEYVLDRCRSIATYTLLDFSVPMLALSRRRLDQHAARTIFLHSSFKTDTWPTDAGGPFDFVFSMQAVHELRHKRHAQRMYEQVRSLLSPTGVVLICDHLPGNTPTPDRRALYMTASENLDAFGAAGFADSEAIWIAHDMALYRARRDAG